MRAEIFTSLLYNLVLLLGLAAVYDAIPLRPAAHRRGASILSGLLIGLIGITVMLNPWHLAPGVFYDTRSILLSIAGVFFGFIPTAIAAIMTSLLRLYQGGAGAPTGVSVIMASAAIGLLWRRFRSQPGQALNSAELYVLGIITHIVMLLLMLTLPWPTALNVLRTITPPVLILYPIGTVLLGLLLNRQFMRRRTENLLRASEERFRALFERAPIAYQSLDSEGRILEVNQTWLEMLGYERAEVIGRWFGDFLSPEGRQLFSERFPEFKRSGEVRGVEFASKKKDGSLRILSFDGKIAYHPDGSFRQTHCTFQDITERKRAEEEAQRSADRLRSLVSILQRRAENIQVLLDYALEEALALTGSTLGYIYRYDEEREEFVLNTWSKGVMHECSVAEPQTTYQLRKTGLWGEAVRQRKPIIVNDFHAPHPLKKGYPAGHVTLHKFMTIPVVSGERIVAVVGVANKATDYDENDVLQLTLLMDAIWKVVERRQTEEALRESQALYRALVESSADHIFLLNPTGIYLSSNRRLADFGLSSDETLVGRRLRDIYPPDLAHLYQQQVQQVVATGQPVTFEHSWSAPDGERFDLDTLYPILEDGAVYAVGGICRDITALKRAEREVERRRQYLENVLACAPDAIVTLDAQGRVVEWNRGAEMIFGYTRDEALGQNLDDLIAAPDRAVHAEAAGYTEQILQGTPVTVSEIVRYRKDGSPVPLIAAGAPVWVEGKVIGLVAAYMDITEHKRAEEERLELERRLLHAQRLESLGVLAGGIAHDFNNLLMAVLGNLDLTMMELSPASPVRENIAAAIHATKRAADLTRQMLAYAGRGRFIVQPLNLNELVEENAHILRTAISRNVQLNVRLASRLPRIQADAGQMQQVVMNLITNASEAIGEQPGVVQLVTGAGYFDETYLQQSRLEEKAPAGTYVWLEVSDSGCGMDEYTLERIFDPFFTTKFTGRGLGMSAVLGIVRGHQGALLIDSALGQGTTVRVLFPALPAESASDSTSKEASQTLDRPNLARPGTILIVDDEEMVCNLAARIAERLGLRALRATNGADALRIFQEHAEEICCVLLDLTMPLMDGAATFQALRQIKPQVKVILSSGYDQREAMERFAGPPPAGFIQKPYTFEALRGALQRLLEAGNDTEGR